MQRLDPDAAFFEDCSEWASLDDLPERPTTGGGEAIVYGHRAWGNWSQYRCSLHLRGGWVGGPYFEIVVPNREPAMTMCRRLPGARQHPGLHGLHGVALSRLSGTWQVPAEHWRDVRAALPALKASIVAWVRRV